MKFIKSFINRVIEESDPCGRLAEAGIELSASIIKISDAFINLAETINVHTKTLTRHELMINQLADVVLAESKPRPAPVSLALDLPSDKKSKKDGSNKPN